MWKVIVVICALGNPCVVMQQAPMEYYHDKNKCMEVAESKHEQLLVGFFEYGYYVESSAFNCIKYKSGV